MFQANIRKDNVLRPEVRSEAKLFDIELHVR